LELLALFLIVFNSNLLVLGHELTVHGVHRLRPDAGLAFLLLHVEVVFVDLSLRRLLLLAFNLIIVFNRFICEYIEAAIQLLLVPLHGNLVDLHGLVPLELRHPLLARLGLDVVPHLEPLPLVLVAQVLLVQTVPILDVHVYRVVHETLLLHGDWQLLHLVFPVDQLLLTAFPRNKG